MIVSFCSEYMWKSTTIFCRFEDCPDRPVLVVMHACALFLRSVGAVRVWHMPGPDTIAPYAPGGVAWSTVVKVRGAAVIDLGLCRLRGMRQSRCPLARDRIAHPVARGCVTSCVEGAAVIDM